MKETIKVGETKLSNRTPFVVPDGYFDQLKSDVMAKLPEQKAKIVEMPRRNRFTRPLIATAASVCIAIFGASAFLFFSNTSSDLNHIAENTEIQAAGNDNITAADYLMIDNSDIYAFVSAE